MTVEIPYGVQTYKRADLPRIRLLNTYVEQVQNQSADIVLLPRPALQESYEVGAGPINGVFQQQGALSSVAVVVSGHDVFAGATNTGTIDNEGLVQMSSSDTTVLIATGGTFWQTDGTATTAITFPDDQNVVSTAFLGGYSFAAAADSRHIYFTLDATTWDGLDYLSAEQSTEYIIGMTVLIDQLIVFCSRHTELFYLTGDPDAPVQRVQGRVFDKGCRSCDAIVRLDNTVFWVGNDNIVYRADNTPVRISDHGIEEQIAASVNVSAWSYPWNGHLFYVLQLDDATYAYDVATQQFHELGSYGLPRWRGRVGLLTDSGPLVGDDVTGKLWALADGEYTEGGAPIVREFTCIIKRVGFLDSVTLDCSIGASATDGLIEVRSSRDNGATWQPWRESHFGTLGQYRKHVSFKRFGLVDDVGMILGFRITDPVPSRISRVFANNVAGGHSRPS